MWNQYRHGLFILIEKLLRWSVNPRLRARLLSICGAHIGRNVRIHEARFINLSRGFSNLHVGDDAYIGPACLLDLEGPLSIGARSTLSPGVTVLTHQDPGSAHQAPICKLYPPRASTTRIGTACWIGANSTLLCGVSIGDLCVVAAGCVVTTDIATRTMAAGNPAQMKKSLVIPDGQDRDYQSLG